MSNITFMPNEHVVVEKFRNHFMLTTALVMTKDGYFIAEIGRQLVDLIRFK